ncbi:hypothetical protein [Mycoplasma bradburyae]|uniref:Uncharacterized protein n=1 Tax=Mycoplasma bradburyae TaxID=2963128 RepID=A0AAW6HQ94_9MOLU|nr:hypothetical protein [Mycoplasma bradburyae]MDC4183173.1 hypothetical protein [Mycoplasma bradburyae]UTS70825.1 hypothetical protein NMG77_03680 [Mycoplasma bradburyae]
MSKKVPLKKTILLSSLGVVTATTAVAIPVSLTAANLNRVIQPIQNQSADSPKPSNPNNRPSRGNTQYGPINGGRYTDSSKYATGSEGYDDTGAYEGDDGISNQNFHPEEGMDPNEAINSPGVSVPGLVPHEGMTADNNGNLSENLNVGAAAGGVIGGIAAVGAIGAGIGLLLNTYKSSRDVTPKPTSAVKKSTVLRDFNLTKSNIDDLADASLEKFDLIEIKDKDGKRGAFWAPKSWFDNDRKNAGIVGGDYVANPEFRSFLKYINQNPNEMGNPSAIINYLAKQNSGEISFDDASGSSNSNVTSPSAFKRSNSTNSSSSLTDSWESYDLDKLFNESDSTVAKPSQSDKDSAKRFLSRSNSTVSTSSTSSSSSEYSIFSKGGITRSYSISDIEEELTKTSNIKPSRGQTSNLSFLTVLSDGFRGKRLEKRIVPRDNLGRPLISQPVDVVAKKLTREGKNVFEQGFYLAQVTYNGVNNERKVSPVFLPVESLSESNKYETAASLKSLFSSRSNSTDPSVYAAALLTENLYQSGSSVYAIPKVDLYGSVSDYQSVFDSSKNSIILVTDDNKEKQETDYSIYARIDRTRKPAVASDATINEVNEMKKRQQALKELAEVPPPLPERNYGTIKSTSSTEKGYNVNLNDTQASRFGSSILSRLNRWGSQIKSVFTKKPKDDSIQFPWYRSHFGMLDETELNKVPANNNVLRPTKIKNRLTSWSSSIRSKFSGFFTKI